MSRKKSFPIVEVEVEDFDKDGYGLAYRQLDDGQMQLVSVPYTVPGDRVKVQLGRKRKGKREGSMLELQAEGPHREAPNCAHFGVCGGCRWQHLAYDKQLERKDAWIARQFAPHIDLDTIDRRPIIPCDPPWRYRNKMEFSFSQTKDGQRFLGLMRSQGRGRVEDLKECHLVSPWFMEALALARQWWEDTGLDAYFAPADRGALRTLTVREGHRSGDRMVMLLLSGNPEYALSMEQIESFKAAMAPLGEGQRLSLFVRIQQIQKGKPTQFYEMHLSGPTEIEEEIRVGERTYTFKVSPTAFFQPNTRQAERLYSLALDMAGLSPDAVVYDLYCGTGTLGILAADRVKKVTGIELEPGAALDAEANAKLNAVENLTVINGDVGKALQGIQDAPDLVMLDPPRAGLDEKAVSNVLRLAPKKILYVSCNPKSQAVNVADFLAAGYQLTAMQAVDQFPHTIHVENVALLEQAPQ